MPTTRSTPHPEGLGAKLAMQARWTVRDSRRRTSITSTSRYRHATNDASEDLAVQVLFGTRTACSSTKGATGTLLGDCGVTEAVISSRNRAGPAAWQANTRRLDPALHNHYLIDNREARVRRVLSNSFGFGGTNCSLRAGTAG